MVASTLLFVAIHQPLFRPGLCSATDEMRCGAPGVMRQRVEAPDGVDASYRLVRTHRSARDRAECRFAVRPLQLVQCVRTVLELDYGLLG